jgi:serine/threonine protein kinase
MAIVYLAHDVRHERDVALKVLRPELATSVGGDRFLREIKIAARLNHPNILALFDSGQADGFLFYVMPYVEGESLRERLIREGELPGDQALRIIKDVAEGLGYAHELGVVHRDIKPANILLSRGHALIADFGIARAVSSVGTATLTATGLSMGTPLYMSPEQAAGDPSVDHRADLYSLGCMLFELLAGKPPFSGPTAQAIMAKHLVDPCPSIRMIRDTVPVAIDAAIKRAMAKLPVDRFASAHAFAKALDAEPVDAVQEIKSVVVLPFENLSPDPDQEYFSDGLTEELIADLSKIRALRVISRTSAMLLKGSEKDVPTLSRELNVRYVLEGSVRQAGRSLRIRTQLIDAATDTHLWAEKYTGTVEDIFDLQEQMSRQIVRALKVRLAPEEDEHLASRDIEDVEAYALYMRARQEFTRMTEASFVLAEQLVERAMARTGPNPLLITLGSEIAFALNDMGFRSTDEILDRGDALATQALALNPSFAEAHMAKGLIAWRRSAAPAAVRHLRKAVELDPGNAMAAWAAGYVLAEIGHTEEAREHGDRARALDPLFWPAQFGSCLADLCDGRVDSALAKVTTMRAVSGNAHPADLWQGVILMHAGRTQEAAESFATVAAAEAGAFSTTAACLGAWAKGDREGILEALAEPSAQQLLSIDKEFSWMVSQALASLGHTEAALEWLSRTIEMGFINHRSFAEHDPFLSKLKEHPRFDALMDRAKEKQQEIHEPG